MQANSYHKSQSERKREIARMSQQGDDERQYRCLKKYEEIVKQVMLLDQLTHESMEARNKSMQQKRKKNAKGNGAGSSTSVPEQENKNTDQVFVQTITQFLHNLNPNAHAPPERRPSNNNP